MPIFNITLSDGSIRQMQAHNRAQLVTALSNVMFIRSSATPNPKVYPLGYNVPSTPEKIIALMTSPDTLLIDIRYKPYSHSSEWCREALEAEYGERYRWAGKYLGNVHYNQPGLGILLANSTIGIAGLKLYLREGYNLILLCQCRDYGKCHRRTVVEMLQDIYSDTEVEL